MQGQKHLVQAEWGFYKALYPANGTIGLRRVMRRLQKLHPGMRTKVFTWNAKAGAYLS
jgi:hypothetical protein